MKAEAKFKYLQRLAETYLLFTKWEGVYVFVNGTVVYLVWMKPKKIREGHDEFYVLDYTMRTFPKSDIGKRITSYKEKIRREFCKRNDDETKD